MHLNEIDFGKLTFRNEQRPWSIECTSTAYCSTMGDVLTVAMSANTLINVQDLYIIHVVRNFSHQRYRKPYLKHTHGESPTTRFEHLPIFGEHVPGNAASMVISHV